MDRTVLIIEDEKLIIVSTQMVLEAAGFRVESADNGEEGIDKARTLTPDLILLDIMMPGIDGWETLTRLKRDPVEILPTVYTDISAHEYPLAERQIAAHIVRLQKLGMI